MEITKATWNDENGSSFDMSMSISKVDKENRLVMGWATVDNVDLQDDEVTFEASQRAFAKFKGNIREMHQPIAAGRMVEYRPQQYVDDEGNTYNGIFMSAYVSKGAQSTWEKVLDKTLSSFSVRGKINKFRMEFRPELNKTVRVVEDYTMTEVSLVDAGGNQYSNLVSIVKDVNGNEHVEGELANVEIHNVFLCKKDRLVEYSTENSLVCQNGHEMTNIGWVEDASDSTMEKVNALVQEHISKNAEGGVDGMADEVTKEETATEPVETETAAVVDEAAGAEEVKTEEEAPAAEEVAPEGDAADELEKSLTAAIEELRKSAQTTDERLEEIIKDVDGKFESFQNDFAERFSKLEEQTAELNKSLASVSEGLSTMSKSVDGLQDASATRKSGDLGGEPEGDLSKSAKDEETKPGIWQGSILF